MSESLLLLERIPNVWSKYARCQFPFGLGWCSSDEEVMVMEQPTKKPKLSFLNAWDHWHFISEDQEETLSNKFVLKTSIWSGLWINSPHRKRPETSDLLRIQRSKYLIIFCSLMMLAFWIKLMAETVRDRDMQPRWKRISTRNTVSASSCMAQTFAQGSVSQWNVIIVLFWCTMYLVYQGVVTPICTILTARTGSRNFGHHFLLLDCLTALHNGSWPFDRTGNQLMTVDYTHILSFDPIIYGIRVRMPGLSC